MNVIGAQCVTVTENNVLPIQGNHNRVTEDCHAGFGGELLTYHEVPVAVHEKSRHAGVGQVTHRGLHLSVVGVGVVVAQPRIEQVAEDVKGFCLPAIVGEKTDKLLADSRLSSLQMKIGNKERSHLSRK